MREIKFRAWDKENEIMICPKGILFDGRVVNFSCGMLEPYGGYELMQYTGLKDKNGKEIYEGDIYKYYILVSAHDGRKFKLRQTEVVEYRDGAFWVGEYLLSEALAHDDGSVIIGNIYENPELLKEESK